MHVSKHSMWRFFTEFTGKDLKKALFPKTYASWITNKYYIIIYEVKDGTIWEFCGVGESPFSSQKFSRATVLTTFDY